MAPNDLFDKRIVASDGFVQDILVKGNMTYKQTHHGELLMDIYYPPGHQQDKPLPAVILIHGDGPWEFLNNIKNSGQYVSWGQLLASSGMITVTFTHRSTEGFTKMDDVVEDVNDALQFVKNNSDMFGIDSAKLGIWVCSAGGPIGLPIALRDKGGSICCIAALYTIMDLQNARKFLPHLDDKMIRDSSAIQALSEKTAIVPPLLIVKAGKDRDDLNSSIDEFVNTASRLKVTLDYYIHEQGRHAFDILDDDSRSTEIISHIVQFFKGHLLVT